MYVSHKCNNSGTSSIVRVIANAIQKGSWEEHAQAYVEKSVSWQEPEGTSQNYKTQHRVGTVGTGYRSWINYSKVHFTKEGIEFTVV